MIKLDLEFSYLGERDYLDITSILDSFWSHLGFEMRKEISNMDFKIVKPIFENCFLLYDEKQNLSANPDALAKFSWEMKGKSYAGILVGNGVKITKRTPESKWDFEAYCDYKDGVMYLKDTFKLDTCYSLTKMGKYLISKTHNPNVRVVRFFFNRLLDAQHLKGVFLKLEEVQRGAYLKVTCFSQNEEVGYILVKT